MVNLGNEPQVRRSFNLRENDNSVMKNAFDVVRCAKILMITLMVFLRVISACCKRGLCVSTGFDRLGYSDLRVRFPVFLVSHTFFHVQACRTWLRMRCAASWIHCCPLLVQQVSRVDLDCLRYKSSAGFQAVANWPR